MGALYGASALRDDWIETCEASNTELLRKLDIATPTFEETAHRLSEAIKQEH